MEKTVQANEFQNHTTSIMTGTEKDHWYTICGVGKKGITGYRNISSGQHRVRIQGWPKENGKLPRGFTIRSDYHASVVVDTGDLEKTIQTALAYIR